MTNYGYALPDLNIPNRKSIWFTGGTIEPACEDDESIQEWKKLFGASSYGSTEKEEVRPEADADRIHITEAERARHLASKILLGAVLEPMDDNGTIGFHLRHPIGGHGSAYCDVVFMDDEFRVMRGLSGSIYVFRKDWIGD